MNETFRSTASGPAVSRRERKERHKAKLRAKREAQNTAVVQPVTQEDIQRVTQAQFEDQEDSVESDAEEEEVAAGETSDVDAEEAAEVKNLLEEENIQLLGTLAGLLEDYWCRQKDGVSTW